MWLFSRQFRLREVINCLRAAVATTADRTLQADDARVVANMLTGSDVVGERAEDLTLLQELARGVLQPQAAWMAAAEVSLDISDQEKQMMQRMARQVLEARFGAGAAMAPGVLRGGIDRVRATAAAASALGRGGSAFASAAAALPTRHAPLTSHPAR